MTTHSGLNFSKLRKHSGSLCIFITEMQTGVPFSNTKLQFDNFYSLITRSKNPKSEYTCKIFKTTVFIMSWSARKSCWTFNSSRRNFSPLFASSFVSGFARYVYQRTHRICKVIHAPLGTLNVLQKWNRLHTFFHWRLRKSAKEIVVSWNSMQLHFFENEIRILNNFEYFS